MRAIAATYYDGSSAAGRAVTLDFDAAGNLAIAGLEQPLRYAARELRISERIGDTPRSIALPGGAQCETLANDLIDAVVAGRGRLLHRMESRWPWILALLALTAAALWGAIRFGVPELARQAAFAMPASADRALARGALEALDQHLFQASRLEPARQDSLRREFGDMARANHGKQEMRLEFRRSERLGANAIALPDGTIVVTDELVRLAQRDEELLAVLAHEIGHVVHRHGLRRVLQSSAVALVVVFATGDVVSSASLAAALPVMLVEARFSRNFETEADLYARNILRRRGIEPQHAVAILRRLAAQRGGAGEGFNYLSSHPGLEERVRTLSGRDPE